MRFLPMQNAESVGCWVAGYIADRINEYQPTDDEPFVLGLPTGGKPIPTYKHLIRLYNESKVEL